MLWKLKPRVHPHEAESLQPLTERDLDCLQRVFQRHPEVRAVYLFGSAAAGRLHPESDLDLAIVADTPDVGRLKLTILTDLARFGYCEVSRVASR